MTFGILIYMISGLIGVLLQQWFALVIIVRAIQGIGASAIKALAIAAGPILGGYVTSTLHWSLLFLIPLFLLPAIPLLLKLPKMNQAGCISQYSLCRPTRNQLYFVWHHDEHDFHHRCRDVCRLFPA